MLLRQRPARPSRPPAAKRGGPDAVVLGLVLCGLALGAAGTRLHAQRRRDAQLSIGFFLLTTRPLFITCARRDDDDRGVDEVVHTAARSATTTTTAAGIEGTPRRRSRRRSTRSSAAPTMEQCASTCTNTCGVAPRVGPSRMRPAEACRTGVRRRSRPWADDEDVTAVIVIQHGDFEYAEDFVCYVWNMLRMEFVGEEHWGARIHIVAPQFWAYDEQHADNRVWNITTHESTLWWEVAGAWMDGGATQEFKGRLSSFSVYDEIIAKVAGHGDLSNMK